MLVQIDVDSTLYDANKLFRQVAKEEFGVEWPSKYYHWFGPEEIGTDLKTLKNIFRRCHSREYVMLQEPYPYAAEVLQGVVEDHNDIELAYVSDRNEQQTGALRDWLDNKGFLFGNPPNEIKDTVRDIWKDTYVAATKDKRHWMRERRPEVVIDDRVRTILMARYELGSRVVSLEHPHNMNLIGEIDHIYIVKDWREIGRILNDTIIPEIQEKTLSKDRELAVL